MPRHRSKLSAKKRIIMLGSALLFVVGAYLLLLALSPRVTPRAATDAVSFEPAQAAESEYGRNQIIIPRIGVGVPFYVGDSRVLEKGAWHRFPERGDPEAGGNFILSAHRFELGWTPQQTRAKSPFYNIHRLDMGDQIFVDYNGERYAYEITDIYTVEPTAVEIESPSENAKLTLYSCTFGGSHDGREVIEAMLLDD